MEYQADTQFEQVDPYAPPTKRQRPAVDSRISEQDDVVVLKEKVIIPVEKYPGHNFVGSIIGPSGSILKELTKQTKSKIAILGKGSMKDKEKEKELMTSEEAEHAHLKEPLHVLIDIKAPRAEAHRRMHFALLEIYKFMVPADKQGQQQHQQQQFNQGPYDGYGGGYGAPQRGRGGPPRGRGGPPRGGPRGRGAPRGAPRGGGYGGY